MSGNVFYFYFFLIFVIIVGVWISLCTPRLIPSHGVLKLMTELPIETKVGISELPIETSSPFVSCFVRIVQQKCSLGPIVCKGQSRKDLALVYLLIS